MHWDSWSPAGCADPAASVNSLDLRAGAWYQLFRERNLHIRGTHGQNLRQHRRHGGEHAARPHPASDRRTFLHRPGEARVHEPAFERQGPDRRRDDRGGGARGEDQTRHDHRRADEREHRDRPGVRLRLARVRLRPNDARVDERRAAEAPGGPRRRDRADPRRPGDDRGDREGRGAGENHSGKPKDTETK